jgi:diadenosine tetraphosphatase ApaH/serine/threonine PP2A family protein phosphatase
MRVVISDVHSNIEAFEAVLNDIASLGIKEILSLGDMIGYGPNPRESIAMHMKACTVAMLGNHEMAVMGDQDDFNERAKAAVKWTKEQLVLRSEGGKVNRIFWDYMGGLKKIVEEEPFVFVHGSPRDYIKEYIFPRDIYDEEKMRSIFALVKKYCIVGHTHIQGIITEDCNFIRPSDIDGVYRLQKEKAIINVGSVGQPRDGDNRAAYAILYDDRVEFRRVPYDYKITMEKIKKVEALPDFLAQRLEEGR